MSNTENVPESTREADVANGENPEGTEHAVGERQAEKNREDDPPA
jgi:hypothetical protein